MSQASVEKKLENFMREFREGMRQDSVISTQTLESLSVDEKQVWRTIRKELEEIGVTVAVFNANKDFIINWFREAVAGGSFEEQSFSDVEQSVILTDKLFQDQDITEKKGSLRWVSSKAVEPYPE